MNFAYPYLLLLVWLIPVLLLVCWYGGRRRHRILGAYAQAHQLAALVPPGLAARRRWRTSAVLCALTLLIAAMAGPQYGYQWEKVERRGVDLILALDCSRSMLSQDIQPSRLARAKREIYDLLSMLEGDRVGLVAFSGTAFLQCPLTVDYNALNLFLSVLTPDYLPVGGTDLNAAVATALDAFDPESAADKAVILITDGENTGPRNPEQAAQTAKTAGVRLFCIGIGSDEGVPVPKTEGGFYKDKDGEIVLSRLDEHTLSRMALISGGAYTRSVAGDMDLESIYRDRIQAKMDAAAIESGRKQVWMERFQWPLGAAVALLVASLWLSPARALGAVLLVAVQLMPSQAVQAGPLQRGYDAYRAGEYQQALDYFIKGQLDAPDDPAVLYNLGNSYYKTKDYEAADRHFHNALEKADDPALKPKLHYNLGNSAYRQGKLQQALEHYETALGMNPDDRQARENLAFVKEKLKQQQQQQQQQQEQSGGNQQQNGNQNQEQQNQNSSRDDDGQQPRPPQQQDQEKQPGDQSPSSTPERPVQDEPEQSGGQNEADADKQQGRSSPQPAQPNLLNRLKDEPGRAMMPAYQKRSVEKDW